MSITRMIFACFCMCLIVLTPPIRSQDARYKQAPDQRQAVPNQFPDGIPGFFDPKTGKFTTQARSAAVPQAAVATTTIIARLIYTFQILNDNLGATTICRVNISTNDAASFPFESGSVTSANGGQSCQVTVLFSWNLATPQTDTITGSYSVSWSGGGSSRSTSNSLDPIPVPANTETITLPTIQVTI
jgi:hypothetical protein